MSKPSSDESSLSPAISSDAPPSITETIDSTVVEDTNSNVDLPVEENDTAPSPTEEVAYGSQISMSEPWQYAIVPPEVEQCLEPFAAKNIAKKTSTASAAGTESEVSKTQEDEASQVPIAPGSANDDATSTESVADNVEHANNDGSISEALAAIHAAETVSDNDGGGTPPVFPSYTETNDDNGDDDDSDDDDDELDQPMTLREHLLDLRKRVTRAFLLVIVGFCVCYPFASEMYSLLMLPVKAAMPAGSVHTFVFTSPAEALFTELAVAFLGGVLLTCPMIFYQFWAFIAPGLYDEEKRYIVPIALSSALLFLLGVSFCYFVAFPFAFDFLLSYSKGDVQAMLKVSDTFSFVVQLLLAFGLIFEFPLIIFFLARFGLVTADLMRRMRRYAIIINVIIAAVLTPPDVISQMLMAVPLLLLYELSIFIAAAFGKKTPPKEEDDDEDDEEEYEDDDDESEDTVSVK